MAQKIERVKTLFHKNNFKLFLELIKAAKMPYEIKQSTYTVEIICEGFNRVQFRQNTMSDKAFVAAAMIKRDITSQNLVAPDIDRNKIENFKFALPEKLRGANNEVWNIDIKSAYATILKNHLIIKPSTYGFLSTLAKKDRLASVGMLASQKKVFYYNENSELIDIGYEINENANFFYFAVQETSNIMNEVKRICGKDFLFYWVDGAYFENEDNVIKVIEFLEKTGYNYSCDRLTNFRFNDNNKRWIIYFDKDGEEKTFNVPKNTNNTTKQLIELLGLHYDKIKK